MNYLKLVEDKVGSVPPGAKYLWFDADTLIYLCSLVDARLDLPLECAEIVLQNAMDEFKRNAEKNLGHEVVILSCLSASYTFRHQVMEDYKGNRKDKWRPPLLNHYRQTFRDMFPTVEWGLHEADDIVATLHYNIPGHVCCSSDKDLKQVPGTLYNPQKETVEDIDHNTFMHWRLYQWLVGDTADGYKGCYLIGDVKAERLLTKWLKENTQLEDIIDEVMELYDTQNKKAIAKGKDPQDPIQMFAVSQIRTNFIEDQVFIPDPFTFLSTYVLAGQDTVMVSEG